MGTGDARGGWAYELWLLAAAGAVTLLLVDGVLVDLDLAVRAWVRDHRHRPLWMAARMLNFAGSANVLAAAALLLTVPRAIRARSWRATGVLLRPILLAYALSHLLIGPIKLLTDRAAPGHPAPDAAELFAHAEGWSYPSGHAANAVLWYGVLVSLVALPAWAHRAARLAPPVVVTVAMVYLNYHWLTDAVTGVLLGLLLDRLLHRAERRLGPDRYRTPVPATA